MKNYKEPIPTNDNVTYKDPIIHTNKCLELLDMLNSVIRDRVEDCENIDTDLKNEIINLYHSFYQTKIS